MPTFYKTLVNETQHEQAQLQSIPQITQALKGQISQATYVAYLEQAYHHVKHTVPLMMAAGSRLPQSKEYLREALVEYVEEEVGHQEWILNDIKTCGANAEIIRHGEPNMATEIMIAFAYDYITRVNPVGFFGMVFVLESTSVQLATHAAQAIKTSLKLPKTAFSYLSSHGSLDIEHMKFFEKLVNEIHDRSDQEAILHIAKRMFVLYGNVFRSIPLTHHHSTEVFHAA